MANQYDEVHARSLAKPEEFWAEAAAQIHWYKTWDKVLDDSRRPFYRWFTGGELNTCYNALDRHVDNGRGEQPAIWRKRDAVNNTFGGGGLECCRERAGR